MSLFVVLVLALGAATPPTAALEVEATSEAAECLGAPALTAEVHRLLGRDPFDPLAARKAHVRVTMTRGFSAEVRVREPDGREGVRVLADADCGALGRSVALALAVAIDPLGLDRPAPFLRPAWAVRPAEAVLEVFRRRREPEPVVAVVRPEEPRRRAVAVSGRASVGLALGLAPDVAFGPAAGVGLDVGRWTFEVELMWAWSAGARVDATRVDTLVTSQRAGAAYRMGAWRVGLGASGASWRIEAAEGLAQRVDDARVLVLLDAGVAWSPTPSTRIDLRLVVPVPRPILVVDGRDVWRAWPVSLGFVVSGVIR